MSTLHTFMYIMMITIDIGIKCSNIIACRKKIVRSVIRLTSDPQEFAFIIFILYDDDVVKRNIAQKMLVLLSLSSLRLYFFFSV